VKDLVNSLNLTVNTFVVKNSYDVPFQFGVLDEVIKKDQLTFYGLYNQEKGNIKGVIIGKNRWDSGQFIAKIGLEEGSKKEAVTFKLKLNHKFKEIRHYQVFNDLKIMYNTSQQRLVITK